MSCMRRLFRVSMREATAQIAAGSQPISVICRIKQMMPRKSLPLKKNDNQGKSTAISIMLCQY